MVYAVVIQWWGDICRMRRSGVAIRHVTPHSNEMLAVVSQLRHRLSRISSIALVRALLGKAGKISGFQRRAPVHGVLTSGLAMVK